MSKNKVKDAYRLIEAARHCTTDPATLNRLDEVEVYDNVEGRDFDSEVVAVGNWNSVRNRETGVEDDTPCRLSDALEKIGVELAWCDCVTTCDNCGKLLNTSPTSYGWQPHYSRTDEGETCDECLDIPAYLESLEGDPKRALNNPNIDPGEHGYVKFQGDFEHGFHPGQDADPKKIAKAMRARGFTRFLFVVDSVGQFDMDFSVWVHGTEAAEHFGGAGQLVDEEIDGPSVSGAMERGLREAAASFDKMKGDGVKVAEIGADGSVKTRVVSPEDFVEHGIRRQENQ